MASSRRTYDTDVITLRTVFAKDVVNSNIPAQRVLTADGAGGTYWAIPSSLGENPAFNQIITSAGTYTADLSYNRFRLLAGEGIGMVNGPTGSNQTTLFSKAFSQVDVSGDNAFYAYTSNTVSPIIRVAATGSIQVRSDPGTNTLFIDGPKTAPYIVSTGIYGFNQLKVTPVASTITSSILGWGGDFITANSPSTLLRFVGVNDIQLSTNVTTNAVFFTISSFNSADYLNISTAAFTAYPNAISTVSSIYTPLDVFNSTVAYLSTLDSGSYSTLKSTIDGIAISTGTEFYILTGLINARATIIQLNSEISNVNTNIQSTSIGLGTLGYISTGGGAPVGQDQLISTVIGLGTAGYLSTAGGASILIESLTSTVQGLGSSGYISSLSTIITSSIFNTGAISTQSLEVYGSNTLTNSGSTILRGATVLQGPVLIQGPVTLVSDSGLTSSSNLTSTTTGLGSIGYISSSSLTSSLVGMGSLTYISTTQLQSSVEGIYIGLQSTVGGLGQIYISSGGGTGNLVTANLTSTVGGLGQIYISTAGGGLTTGNLVSTVGGLGQIYISTAGGGITSGNLTSTVGGLGQIYISTAGGGLTPGNLTSTVGGLGQIYISTAGGGITQGNLLSTVGGLGQIYISTAGGGTGNITTANLNSSITGLGSAGFVSTASLISTVEGIGFYQGSLIYDLVTPSTVRGLGTSGYVSSTQLNSTVRGLGTVGFVSSTQLNSSIEGLGTAGFVSTLSLVSTFIGLQRSDFVSSPNLLNLVSTQNLLNLVSTPNLLNLLSTQNLLNLVSTPNLLNLVSTPNLLNLVSTSGLASFLNSTVTGLATTGYISTLSLASTVTGLASSGYVSTTQLVSTVIGIGAGSGGVIIVPFLNSTVTGLATAGYVSSLSLTSTVAALATEGYVSSLSLTSTVTGLATAGYVSSLSLTSTITGLATAGYISSLSLTSTVNSLLNRSAAVPFVSAFTVSTGSLNASTISFPYPSTTQFLWVVGNAGPTTSFSTLQYSGDTFNWSNCAGSLFNTTGYAVAYNNSNLWVAVGQDTTPSLSTIKYSRDGINWSNASGSVFTLAGRGVAYNGTQWLALGGDNGASRSTIKYSGDGINWSNATGSVFTGAGHSAAWNGSFWVAVGSNNPIDSANIKYSGDGINWSNSGVAFNTFAIGVAWNGTRFVAVGSNNPVTNGNIKYSGDGLLWSNAVTTLGAAAAFGFFGLNVAWNGSYFLAGGADTSDQRVRQSADGITWTSTIVGSGYNRTLTWNGSLWLYGTSGQTPALRYSGDAQNWSNVTNYAPNAAWGAAFSSNTPPSTQTIRVEPTSMVLNNTLRVDIQTNRVGINTSNPLFDLDVGGAGRFSTLSTFNINVSSINGQPVGSGSGSSGPIPFLSAFTVSTGTLLVSTISYVNVNPSTPFLWVAGTSDTVKLQYSGDGMSFSNCGGDLFTSYAWRVAYNGNLWVAAGADSGATKYSIRYSGNGITWSNTGSAVFATSAYGVAWNGRLWVATGTDTTTIKYSGDGINWSNCVGSLFNNTGRDVAWNGSLWIAMGSNSPATTGTIKYSGDGITWSNATGFSNIGYGIAWNGRLWVAAGQEGNNSPGNLKWSVDGITWSNSLGNIFSDYSVGVAWNGKIWVAIGSDGATSNLVKYSIDGITWSNTPTTTFSANPTSIVWNGSYFLAAFTTVGSGTKIKMSSDGILWSNVSSAPTTPYGLAFSSNVIPAYKQSNLAILSQNIPLFFTSTNSILAQTSSLVINNTLVVDVLYDRVGINTNFPQVDLDVNGTGRFSTLSTLGLFVSSINGQVFTGGAAGITTANLTSTVAGLGQAAYISTTQLTSTVTSLQSNAIAINLSTGLINVCTINNLNFSTGFMTASTINNLVVATRNPVRIWVASGVRSAGAGQGQVYSFDGITWTNSGLTGNLNTWCLGVAWNGSLFVSVGSDSGGNTIKYSGNGINWSNITSGNFTGAGAGVAWNGRYWLALGNASGGTGSIKVSFDTLNWQDATGGLFGGSANAAAWNGFMWVAVGVNPASSNGTIRYSYNGFDWFPTQGSGFTASGGGNQVAWNGRLWVAAGTGSGAANSPLKYSGDGINWSNAESGALYDQNIGNTVMWTGKYFLSGGVSYGGGTMRFSSDGCNWFSNSGGFTTFSGNPPETKAIVFNGTMYVATGYVGGPNTALFRYSFDGFNWFGGTQTQINEYGWNNGLAFSSNVIQTYRQDLISFTQQNIPSFFFSTNQIQPQISSLLINETLLVDRFYDRVGINCNLPGTDLDVNGIGRFQQVSSVSLFTSTATFNTMTIGLGGGWLQLPPAQSVYVSTVYSYSALGYVSSFYAGSTTTITPGYTAWLNGPSRIQQLLIGQTSTPNMFAQPAFDLHLINNSALKPLTNTWSVGSDMRIKENIMDADIDRCYDAIKEIKLRRFAWQSTFFDSAQGSDRRVLGFVAQEVSTIFPKTVEIKEAYGFSNFHFLNIDQIQMSLFGAVQKTIQDKEHMESTIKGQRFEIETLRGTQTFILSTLEGMQRR